MYLHFSESAIQEINRRIPPNAIIRLVWDIEGCGCALSGVAALHAQNTRTPDDVDAESNAFTVQYDPRKEVFFEDRMTVDFQPSRGSFILKSSQQTYNAAMQLVSYCA
ncbi:iron-sulfur cluster biosynthesis family protein [Paenibacillus lutrae]|uniref:Core domain-containing protein n=1 Tax=Paenibacillus lutrae TaxID=2078573 RepID=A0A7X3FIZ3_9BACL|nr:iron-sulfur cluster biosynthesis family protein [Paenibacillus lutrae]MVP00447.1 hypothetical protein [Paenibacillus lutrae]